MCKIVAAYQDILYQGFDSEPVSPSDFIPCNLWKKKGNWIVDQCSGQPYLNDSPKIKRCKSLVLLVATAILHLVGLVLNAINRAVKVITLAHFWYKPAGLGEFCMDTLRLALTPIVYVGLIFSALYGLVLPNDGGKLYASFERFAYGRWRLAPCFQPNADVHLFGGDIEVADQW